MTCTSVPSRGAGRHTRLWPRWWRIGARSALPLRDSLSSQRQSSNDGGKRPHAVLRWLDVAGKKDHQTRLHLKHQKGSHVDAGIQGASWNLRVTKQLCLWSTVERGHWAAYAPHPPLRLIILAKQSASCTNRILLGPTVGTTPSPSVWTHPLHPYDKAYLHNLCSVPKQSEQGVHQIQILNSHLKASSLMKILHSHINLSKQP